MAGGTSKKPPKPPPSLLHRALAVAACLVTAAGFYHVKRLPLASPITTDAAWTVQPGESVSLVLPPEERNPRRIFSLEGPAGGYVRIDFSRASLGPAAPPEIVKLPGAVTEQPVPIQWRLDSVGESHAFVDVSLTPSGRQPILVLSPDLDPESASLALEPRDASLTFDMNGAFTGGAAEPTAKLVIGDGFRMRLPNGGALTIPVVVQARDTAKIIYPVSAAADAVYAVARDRNGMPGPGVLAEAISIQRADHVERLYACGDEAKISWTKRNVAAIPCRSPLRVTGLKHTSDGLRLDVTGSGFLVENGQPKTLSIQEIKDNPVIAAIVTAFSGGLVAWTIKVLRAPLPKRNGGSKRKPRDTSGKG
jgi:hypothetical protein